MEAGDFSQNLADRLIKACLDSGDPQLSPAIVLEEARANSSCSDDPWALNLNLSFNPERCILVSSWNIGNQVPPAHDPLQHFKEKAAYLDSAVLTASCAWPYCDLLHMHSGGSAAKSYSSVFSILLRLRACQSRLHSSWLVLSRPCSQQPISNDIEQQLGSHQNLRTLRMWHRQALHFITGLQQHIQGRLFGANWQSLIDGLTSKPVDVAEMATLHSEYLESALETCLLPQPNSSDPGVAPLVGAVIACEGFSVLCCSFLSSGGSHVPSALNYSCGWFELLQLSHEDINANLRSAMIGLRNSTSVAGLDVVMSCVM